MAKKNNKVAYERRMQIQSRYAGKSSALRSMASSKPVMFMANFLYGILILAAIYVVYAIVTNILIK